VNIKLNFYLKLNNFKIFNFVLFQRNQLRNRLLLVTFCLSSDQSVAKFCKREEKINFLKNSRQVYLNTESS